jgi:hypothetical protein
MVESASWVRLERSPARVLHNASLLRRELLAPVIAPQLRQDRGFYVRVKRQLSNDTSAFRAKQKRPTA